MDFIEIWYLNTFPKSVEKMNEMNTGALHKDLCAFKTISRSILLRMRNVLDKVVQKIKTHILGSMTSFRKSCLL